jgi:RluA family pseudouridine synthase
MENENPWKTLDKKVHYDNPWIRVEEHQVINPSGNPGIYGKVCVKNKAVGVVPIDEYGNVWLVGQYRYTLDEYSWEIIAGGGPLDEDTLDTAKRELKEETGLVANHYDLLMKMHLSNSISDEESFIYVAKELEMTVAEPEDTEELVIKKLPFPQVLDMVLNGRITDAMSVAAILKMAQLDLAEKQIPILYRDKHCVIVNKPAGLLVHRTKMSRDKDFLLQRVRNQIKEKVHPVHRLDKPTSGIVVFGLSSEATSEFAALFQERDVKKTYLAVVRGYTDDQGVIDSPIRNKERGNIEQDALTEYETLSRTDVPIPVGPHNSARYSLVKINLKTGRMHQIRRHFAHIRHPVMGDSKYGDGRQNKMLREKFHNQRLLLMAVELEFTHPYNQELITIKAPIDPDFENLCKQIGLKI